MNIEYHSFYSSNLCREMPFKRYGHSGKVIMVFPSSGGRFYEYEDFKMIESIAWFIDNGHIQIFAVDSVDNEAFLANWKNQHDKAEMHNAFDRYIVNELVGFIKDYTNNPGPFMTTGCSMGAYHAVNFLLRHPDVFDSTIALSGVYDIRYIINSNYNEFNVYENSPVDYIWNQNDPWFVDKYRQSHIIIATGQGKWEEQSIKDTRIMEDAFKFKNIPAWIDYWGYDVDHDWPWWRIQMSYYLGKLLEQGLLY